MQSRFFCRILAFLSAAVLLSSCARVSEGSAEFPEIIAPGSEITDPVTEATEVPEMAEISTYFPEASDTKEELTEETSEITTETTQATNELPTEAVTTEEEPSGTVLGVSETAKTTAKTSKTETTSQKPETAEETYIETAKITLQPESPPETTAKKDTAPSGQNSYSALNYTEQKGFWITYLEYGNILKNKSRSSFEKSIGQYFDNIASLGFNTVYVQVRAFGDAYYDSELYPSGEQFNGTIGTSNRFDALQVMIDCAHDRGLSLHAWVNPMRLMYPSQIQGIDSSYPIKKWYDDSSLNGKYIVESGGRLYLNPAYDDVTDLIASGIAEIVSGYDVDGVQIDDYFYPTTASSFDSAAYSASGTSSSLSSWRTENVNKMVRKIYSTVHKSNNSVVFGISPQGSVENNYKELYADVRKWCSESGYCDYILPQVYFGFNSVLPYADIASQWNSMVSGSGVKLVIGLAAYKIGAPDSYAGSAGKNEWVSNSDIIARQMALAKSLSNYGGVALYRYDSLFNPTSDVAAQVSKEISNIPK